VSGFLGLGDTIDFSAIPLDTLNTINYATPDLPSTIPTSLPSVSSATPAWIQSLITGAVGTAEKIGLQQTVPAGTYTVRNANGSFTTYQQPTSGPAASAVFSLPGALSTAGGSSMLWLALLAIGGIVLFRAVGGGR